MHERLPRAHVAHTMPGRTRLRVPDRRGDTVYFASVATALSTLPGIYHVDVKPLTGSLLIQHGPPIERIALAAENARLFRLSVPEPAAKPARDIPFDPKMMIGLGLGVLALWQLTEKKFLPPAITLAWYAAQLGGLFSEAGFEPADE